MAISFYLFRMSDLRSNYVSWIPSCCTKLLDLAKEIVDGKTAFKDLLLRYLVQQMVDCVALYGTFR